jgi:cytidylate kinase
MSEGQAHINLTVSGWPGAGSTTLALLLAVLLKRNFLTIGAIYRDLGVTMGYKDEGVSRPKFDDYIESIIGKTTDNYVDYKLEHSENLLIESDIGAFRLGRHPKIFSIFLCPPESERLKRVETEGRDDAHATLALRDKGLQTKYIELWNIDIFDKELIERKHNLVLDNSNMSLETEIKLVLKAFIDYEHNSEIIDMEALEPKLNQLVGEYWKKGKDFLKETLRDKKLLISSQQQMQEITAQFPEDVTNFPDNIKSLFLNQPEKNN